MECCLCCTAAVAAEALAGSCKEGMRRHGLVWALLNGLSCQKDVGIFAGIGMTFLHCNVF